MQDTGRAAGGGVVESCAAAISIASPRNGVRGRHRAENRCNRPATETRDRALMSYVSVTERFVRVPNRSGATRLPPPRSDPVSEAALAEDLQDEPQAPQAADTSAHDGPSCEKCGLATNAAACPRCGWYPSLGIHVDIDDSYEAAMNTVPADPEEAEAAAQAQQKPEWQKHIEVWRDLIPMWGWIMIGTTVGTFAAAIVCRVLSINSPSLQTMIGVSGLIGGALLAIVAHIVAFLICSFDDADFGALDIVIKPGKTWKRILSELPNRVWLANSANLGLSAAVSAALIVGGIPYEVLLDWGIKARPKASLLQAIAENAPAGNDDMTMEEAMGQFADKAGAEGLEGKGSKQDVPPPAPKPRQRLECLIIGYQTDRDGALKGLLLAATENGKLKYVGRVTPDLDPKEEANLIAGFEKSTSTRPFVKTPESGAWLRPKYTCRVTYTEWPRGKRPKDLEFDELLDTLATPW